METLVVLGSWGRDERSYFRLVESAPKNWKILVISYNEVTPQGKTDTIAKNILQFLDKHSINSCTLLGHSLGGAFALSFSALYPKRIKRLVLVDSLGVKDNSNLLSLFFREASVQIGNMLIAKNLKTIYKIELITTLDTFANPQMYWRLAKYVQKLNLEETARQIIIPTLLVWGEKDSLTPLVNGKKLQNLIKNSKLEILKGLNHEWILHYPEKLWKLLE